MIKKICCIWVCIFLVLGTGCQKSRFNTAKMGDKFVLGQDDQPNLNNNEYNCLKMEEGYFVALDKLQYLDWNTKQIVPLCNKAECTHKEGADCDAMQYVLKAGYYNEKIYFTCSSISIGKTIGISLCCMDKDGTKRELLYEYCKFSDGEEGGKGISANACIHRGYLYYAYMNYDEKTEKYSKGIARRKLVKNAKEEIIYVKEDDENWKYSCGIMKGYGECILFRFDGYNDKTQESYQALNSYNIQSQTVENLKEIQNNKFYGFTVLQDNVYYKIQDEIIKYDTKAKKETVIFDSSNLQDINMNENEISESSLCGDNTYLYLDNENVTEIKEADKKLYVLDCEGKLVDGIGFGDENADDTCFLGSDDRMLLFRRVVEYEEVFYYCDKEQIGTGQFELHELAQ